MEGTRGARARTAVVAVAADLDSGNVPDRADLHRRSRHGSWRGPRGARARTTCATVAADLDSGNVPDRADLRRRSRHGSWKGTRAARARTTCAAVADLDPGSLRAAGLVHVGSPVARRGQGGPARVPGESSIPDASARPRGARLYLRVRSSFIATWRGWSRTRPSQDTTWGTASISKPMSPAVWV